MKTPRPTKHIMISYQWEVQEFAKDLYNALVVRGFNVWMDIQGGMYANIYESMARAVNNAALVIPLLTPEYEKSANCQRECELAAKLKVPMIPLRLTNFEPTSWAATAIRAGELWYPFYSRELTSQTSLKMLDNVMDAIKQHISLGSQKPQVFLSYSTKNYKLAKSLKRFLNPKKEAGKEDLGKEFVFDCILPRRPETKDKGKTEKKDDKEKDKAKEKETEKEKEKEPEKKEPEKEKELETEGEKPDTEKHALLDKLEKATKDVKSGQEKQTLIQQRTAIEEHIRSNTVVAIILIITPDFEMDDDCKYEVNLAYSSRKLIIPTLWEPLKNGYPPQPLAFCLKSLTFVDFTKSQQNDTKMKLKVDYIRKLLKDSKSRHQLTNIITDKNFMVKNVGEWTEVDVSNWLRYINLGQYGAVFRNNHVNGRVLFTLTDTDLETLKMSKLHQRLFLSKLNDFHHSFAWTELEVAEWLESLKLNDCKDALFDSGIDGKSLWMLAASDLQSYGVTNRISQERLLQEIYLLKLEKARVREHKDLYRFEVLKDVLVPVASDQISSKFRFSPQLLDLIQHIVTLVDNNPQGLTQTGVKKFLFSILVAAYVYRKSYPTKILWYDATYAEIYALKRGFLGKVLVKPEDDEGGLDYFFAIIEEMEEDTKKEEEERGEEDEEEDRDNLSATELFVANLWMTYITLDNIIDRLFAVWDRLVNGLLTISEIVAGLNLLIYSPDEAKYKLAFSLIDFNGDGSITREEFANFYKQCFLPVLRSIRRSRTLPDFKSLNKYSFLYYVYEQLKEELDVSKRPSLLNEDFTIEHYNGGMEPGPNKLTIENALVYGGRPHCSQEGRNWDLILKSKAPDGVYLTNVFIGGGRYCTCYLRHAAMWISNEPIDFASYTSKFDNLTEKQFAAMPPGYPNRPFCFITTDANYYFSAFSLPEPKKVKYIHIKFIRPHKQRDNNYDSGSDSGSYDSGEESGGDGDSEKGKEPNAEGGDSDKEASVDEENKAGEAKQTAAADVKEQAKQEHGESGSESGEEAKPEASKKTDGAESDKSGSESDEEEEIIDPEANIDLEFLGLWGFENEPPKSAHKVDTMRLYRSLAGTAEDDDDSDYGRDELDQEINVVPGTFNFLNAAKHVADGLPLPENSPFSKEDVDALLKHLSFVEPESGGSITNQARFLQDLLPVLQLFKLFMGYTVTDVLTSPM